MMYIIKVVDYKPPLEVEVEVENRNIKFELDTGSGISIISEGTLKKQFTSYKLGKADLVVKTYSNQRLHVLGKFNVQVKYEDKS